MGSMYIVEKVAVDGDSHNGYHFGTPERTEGDIIGCEPLVLHQNGGLQFGLELSPGVDNKMSVLHGAKHKRDGVDHDCNNCLCFQSH